MWTNLLKQGSVSWKRSKLEKSVYKFCIKKHSGRFLTLANPLAVGDWSAGFEEIKDLQTLLNAAATVAAILCNASLNIDEHHIYIRILITQLTFSSQALLPAATWRRASNECAVQGIFLYVSLVAPPRVIGKNARINSLYLHYRESTSELSIRKMYQ